MKKDMKKIAFKKTGATTNITQLRDRMAEVFDLLADAQINPLQAKEMTNAAGKIINSAKVQIEYATVRKEKPNIPFLK